MSNNNTLEITNPFTEEITNTFEYENQESVKSKLDKAHKAFNEWKDISLEKRIDHFNALITTIESKREEFVKVMTEEMGKTTADGNAEVDTCLDIINYCVQEAPNVLSTQKASLEQGRAFNHFSPMGVIFSIQPWNFPMYQVIRYSVPALLVGNTTLLKHASTVWGSAKLLEESFRDANFPEGVFTHLYAKSDDLEFLYSDSRVKMVTFTGSPDTGRKVAEIAAKNLKKTVLELGGNDAYIVLEDADIEMAVKACVKGRMYNSSETCTAAKRFIVVDKIYDKFKELFVQEISKVKFGDPKDSDTDIGPLARKDLLETLEKQVKESVDKGASCLCGGKRADTHGYFYEPTVIENLKPGMPAYDDELFGPVASLIRAKDEDDAIEISNSSQFGLGGGIFSHNVSHAKDIAFSKLDTGMININGYTNEKPNLPFGGVKNSGYGREHGHFGFYEYMNIKSVRVIESDS